METQSIITGRERVSARQRTGLAALNDVGVPDGEIAYEMGVTTSFISHVRAGNSLFSSVKEDLLWLLCLDRDRMDMVPFLFSDRYAVVRLEADTVDGCILNELQPAIEELGQSSARWTAGDHHGFLSHAQRLMKVSRALVAEGMAVLHRQKEACLNGVRA